MSYFIFLKLYTCTGQFKSDYFYFLCVSIPHCTGNSTLEIGESVKKESKQELKCEIWHFFPAPSAAMSLHVTITGSSSNLKRKCERVDQGLLYICFSLEDNDEYDTISVRSVAQLAMA